MQMANRTFKVMFKPEYSELVVVFWVMMLGETVRGQFCADAWCRAMLCDM